MRSTLKRRIKAILVMQKVNAPRRLLVGRVAPFNYWNITGVKVNDTIISREGNLADYETLLSLNRRVKEHADKVETKREGIILIRSAYILEDGAEPSNYHDYTGKIPELFNTHLCPHPSYTNRYDQEGMQSA